ncbi:tetratricopeptide repeat protein [Streptomyces sp. NPDC101209]|uniref:tetratricopeptide repeat protein n=1 Tax=Streptomyces sp. NPDC101209 TaxID=3366129 RepID=UPI003827C534
MTGKSQLADLSGVGRTTVHAVFKDDGPLPSEHTVAALATALSLPVGQLLQLRRAAAEASRTPSGTEPAPGTPRQLPRQAAQFVGRTKDLALISATGSCVLHGTAGVGKTALAVHFGHQQAARFPDGQLYADLRGFAPGAPADAADVLRGLLLALGVPESAVPPDESARAAAYRSAVAGRRILVVLDNVRDSAQARPLLPGAAESMAVLTSRHRLDSLAAREGLPHIGLDLLPPADARDLLAHRLGAERTGVEPAAVDALVEACARLPLALCLVAARASAEPGTSLTHTAAELQDARSRLDHLALGEDDTDLRAVFSWSTRALSAPAARLFRLSAVNRGPDLTAAAAASIAGQAVPATRTLLRQLVSSGLLEEHAPGRYRSHDLLRVYAAELLAEEGEETCRNARRRLLDHFLHTGLAANRSHARFRQGITPAPPTPGAVVEAVDGLAEANAWFARERPNLVAAVADAAAHGLDTYSWQLPWVLTTHLYRYGHWEDLTSVQKTAGEAAARAGDPAAQARACRDLGRVAVRLGRYGEARDHHTQALTLCTASGDLAGQAHSHNALSLVLERLGDPEESAAHARRAVELYAAEGNEAWRAAALSRLGIALTAADNHRAALACCLEALEILVDLDDRYYQAHVLATLGVIQHRLGAYDEAVARFQDAVELWRAFENRFEEASALHRLGDAHHAGGHAPAARRAWSAALALLNDLAHADAAAVRAKLAPDSGCAAPGGGSLADGC